MPLSNTLAHLGIIVLSLAISWLKNTITDIISDLSVAGIKKLYGLLFSKSKTSYKSKTKNIKANVHFEPMEHSNIILRITEYGIKHKSFTMTKIIEELAIPTSDLSFLDTLTSKEPKSDNPQHVLVFVHANLKNAERHEKALLNPYANSNCVYQGKDDDYYAILPTAFYNFVGYIEIKEARKHADEAKRQSTLALSLTQYALIISILFGLMEMLFKVSEILHK